MGSVSLKHPDTARSRVVIETVEPSCDAGRFAVKRIVGDLVQVTAHIFCDSHDSVAAVLRYQHQDDNAWTEIPLIDLPNDEWQCEFRVQNIGVYRFHVVAWADHFVSWKRDLAKRVAASHDIAVDLEIGARLIDAASDRARSSEDQQALAQWAGRIRLELGLDIGEVISVNERLETRMLKNADRSIATTSDGEFQIVVDRPRARFSSWYELFPRSCSMIKGQHGTLRDVVDFLPYVASMGFDIVYMPPIHPIGVAHRKGQNNSTDCLPNDVGCPWAIGGKDGGHKSIHRDLGTIDDFRALIKAGEKHGLEFALDIAFQCSPDHPYVVEHPDWFKARPDGTIQYAENPPKKYQDIYPFDFECTDWQSLWLELKSIFDFWIDEGVRVFRVDNPHTKPFGFWEWCITEIRKKHPDVLFLAEAFTRPKIMKRLGKLGFSQSYSYFTWRNEKNEIEEYMQQLGLPSMSDVYRPNFWPNTPDILHKTLQDGGRSTFEARVILAATLSSNYGIYGPSYELCENAPVKSGSEEYLDSEKYEIRQWTVSDDVSIRDTIQKLNEIRNSHGSLQSNELLCFHETDNEHLICYSKRTLDFADVILVVLNLDAENKQWGHVDLNLSEIGKDAVRSFEVTDLLTGKHYQWESHNFVELGPHNQAAHIMLIR
jgi:starch synthase (maltosyl-transferring)